MGSSSKVPHKDVQPVCSLFSFRPKRTRHYSSLLILQRRARCAVGEGRCDVFLQKSTKGPSTTSPKPHVETGDVGALSDALGHGAPAAVCQIHVYEGDTCAS